MMLSVTTRADRFGEVREGPDGMRILHVVEKYRSGVGSAIAQYTRSVPDMEHFLLSGTAVDAEGDLAEQASFAGTYLMDGSLVAKVRRIREVVAELRPDVVHAHSSHGGAFARLAIRSGRHPIVYTPHCFAFERQDVSRPARTAFRVIEAALAVNTTVVAACSRRELALSAALGVRRPPVVLVPNIAPAGAERPAEVAGRPATVVGGGRISPQKDPAFFARAVQALRREEPALRAVWLGDGDPAVRATLELAGVEVSGWLPRSAVVRELGQAALYLHSALWEGFPLMVAEAVALGVPTLVRPVPSFEEVPAALTLSTSDDLAGALACLREPDAAKANVDRWATLLEENTVAVQARGLAEAYRMAVAPGRPWTVGLPSRRANARASVRRRASSEG
jgi:glycosyltransferase involved in cell wall biosynthesis